MTILSSGVAMVFLLGSVSKETRPPIYSNGAQHWSLFPLQTAWQPYLQYCLHMQHEALVCYRKH
jgi:hypothetical protein